MELSRHTGSNMSRRAEMWLCAAVTGLAPKHLLAFRGGSDIRDALIGDETRLMQRLHTLLYEYTANGLGEDECRKRLTAYISRYRL